MHQEISEELINTLFIKIMEKPKYRKINVPKETITELLKDSITKYRTKRDIEHAVEEKLHNIVATYLGDIN